MKWYKNRYFLLSASFVIIFVILVFQMADLQIIHGKENEAVTERNLFIQKDIPAPRGDIVDRNNIDIASNRMGFTVSIVKVGLPNDKLNGMLLNLVDIFESNNETYFNNLSNYLTFDPIAYASTASQSKINSWLKEAVANKPADLERLKSPGDVFKYLRDEKYKIGSGYSDADAYKIMTVRYEMQMQGFTVTNPLYLAKDVSEQTVAELAERSDQFPGVFTDNMPVRTYVDAQFEGQVIGYVRGISSDQYKALKSQGYQMTDIIGKSGVEAVAEQYLKGKDGAENVETDTSGGVTHEISQTPAVPGDNIVLTLDTKLQKVAMDSLARNIDLIKKSADYKSNFGDAFAGAAVAMDVNSGQILAMASYPSYDPSVYIAGKNNTDAKKIIAELNDPKNSGKPLFNRAISGSYAPGSTFKPITAIAGLESNVITPQTIIRDTGVVNIGGRNFYSLEYRQGLGALGDLNLERALATSNNIYFHLLGVRTGIDSIDKWATLFGLGQKTGIDLPGESKGVLAGIDYKKKMFNDEWRPADTAQAAIGQLYNNFTPLQLADYVSAVANGGKLYTPYVIQKIVSGSGALVQETQPQFKSIPIQPSTIAAVKAGMVAVTNSSDGTAATIFDGLPFKVAGKTGTAETGAESSHSSNALFVCYAPADKPQIAIAVVVEHGAWGANTAPIARDIIDQYFGLNNPAANTTGAGVTTTTGATATAGATAGNGGNTVTAPAGAKTNVGTRNKTTVKSSGGTTTAKNTKTPTGTKTPTNTNGAPSTNNNTGTGTEPTTGTDPGGNTGTNTQTGMDIKPKSG